MGDFGEPPTGREFPSFPVAGHVCIKPSVRQNKLPAGTQHICHGCGSVWVVGEEIVSVLGGEPKHRLVWVRA